MNNVRYMQFGNGPTLSIELLEIENIARNKRTYLSDDLIEYVYLLILAMERTPSYIGHTFDYGISEIGGNLGKEVLMVKGYSSKYQGTYYMALSIDDIVLTIIEKTSYGTYRVVWQQDVGAASLETILNFNHLVFRSLIEARDRTPFSYQDNSDLWMLDWLAAKYH